MRYRRRPKYKLNKSKINIPKDEEITAEDIYKQTLIDKKRRRKPR